MSHLFCFIAVTHTHTMASSLAVLDRCAPAERAALASTVLDELAAALSPTSSGGVPVFRLAVRAVAKLSTMSSLKAVFTDEQWVRAVQAVVQLAFTEGIEIGDQVCWGAGGCQKRAPWLSHPPTHPPHPSP